MQEHGMGRARERQANKGNDEIEYKEDNYEKVDHEGLDPWCECPVFNSFSNSEHSLGVCKVCQISMLTVKS